MTFGRPAKEHPLAVDLACDRQLILACPAWNTTVSPQALQHSHRCPRDAGRQRLSESGGRQWDPHPQDPTDTRLPLVVLGVEAGTPGWLDCRISSSG